MKAADGVKGADGRLDEPVTPAGRRSGAHRPRRPAVVESLPALLVLLIVVGVGVGVWQLARTTTTAGPDARASAGPAAPLAAPTTPASASASPSVSASLDRSLAVRVLNATGRAGLASATARLLRSAGWSATAGNSTSPAATTTVYYPREADRVSAEAVAAVLAGRPPARLSTAHGPSGVTVVLGADAAG